MILVTGANGFVGRQVVASASERGIAVRGAVRRAVEIRVPEAEYMVGAELESTISWMPYLRGVETVIHTAARVHVMNETANEPLADFRRINVDGTINLARQSAAAGVRRFIFISSIKVNGEHSLPGVPFNATDIAAPGDPYGVSKYEAESALWTLARETSLEVVVIRPVLIYGPGVKANFAAMMKWLQRGVPLPFGAIYNKRSLVALDNLVDLILTCVASPAAAGQTFLVSDDEDLSTTALLKRMAIALGVSSRLIPVPSVLLSLGARLGGRENLRRRLFDSLQVNINPTKKRLAWRPPITVDDALRKAAADFLARQAGR
jgi:UDP-glucose 4-epimerase